MKNVTQVFPLDNSPGYIINRLARELNACLYRSFRRHGFEITAQQWAVLNRLWEIEGLHQSELAEKTTKNRHNMARILNNLEAKGLIKRKPDSKDKRLQRVYLTAKGKSLKGKLIPIALETLENIFAGIKQQDIQSLERIHKKIIKNIESLTNN